MSEEDKFVISDTNKTFSQLSSHFKYHVYKSLIPELSQENLSSEAREGILKVYNDENPLVVNLIDEMTKKVSEVVEGIDKNKNATVNSYINSILQSRKDVAIEKEKLAGRDKAFGIKKDLYEKFSMLKPALKSHNLNYRKISDRTKSIIYTKFVELVDGLDELRPKQSIKYTLLENPPTNHVSNYLAKSPSIRKIE